MSIGDGNPNVDADDWVYSLLHGLLRSAQDRFGKCPHIKTCIAILCNKQDVQDVIQDTFCRYIEKKPIYRNEEHEKAWWVRVATDISGISNYIRAFILALWAGEKTDICILG